MQNSRSKKTKVAIVNQYCDSVLPPFQNSVGICTYGLAAPLAQGASVLVYGLRLTNLIPYLDLKKRRPEGLKDNHWDKNINYRFMRVSMKDIALFCLFQPMKKFLKLFRRDISPFSTSPWLFPEYGKAIAQDLTFQNCDIIHFQHATQSIPITKSLNPSAKIVLALHHEFHRQCDYPLLNERLQHVDWITCVSDYLTQKTKQDFPELADRCSTVYNGINPSDFVREPNFSLRRVKKRLVFVGSLTPQKGIHVLIDAFIRVAQIDPDVELEIIGPDATYPLEETFSTDDPLERQWVKDLTPFYPNYREKLEARVPKAFADRIHFAGLASRQQVIEQLYQADLCVFPSLWNEAFGLPPIEAMAAGTPVIATRMGALPETIVDGETGLLVERDRADDLAEAILSLLGDDRRREAMGRAARQRALTHFTWEQTAEKMLDLYQELSKREAVAA